MKNTTQPSVGQTKFATRSKSRPFFKLLYLYSLTVGLLFETLMKKKDFKL